MDETTEEYGYGYGHRYSYGSQSPYGGAYPYGGECAYEPGGETLAAIAALHGAAPDRVRPLVPAFPSGGANHVFALGDRLVLRIPRSRRFLPGLAKEAAVIPAARAAGVRTPEVVAFDGTCSSVGVPYMVLARAPGADLAAADLPEEAADRVYHQVGRELARLHRLSPASPEAPGLRSAVPEDDEGGDPRDLVARLLAEGWIDAGAARWLTGWFDRLSEHRPRDSPRVLTHGDIAPQNLVVSPRDASLTGIVDWGDAQWADPAAEFAKIPPTGVPAMLAGYGREAGGGAAAASGRAWAARVLWCHLTWALARLRDPAPRPGERHWTAPSASRLLGLLRFYAAGAPGIWAGLT
ncbi:aminoglycoside phosphotransferase family protein [Streptomyces sp. B1866]|uniref:phosphotransferase family protein n=1 Tax=Streptomyces sp. B1866 TaxID=3075431 RepID=UPI00288F73DA|nr:aminoglycoside phosphotransferase family protein [Streptomyces sp. B1866]MDT3395084.1 aminoglycoside phosphotransferase family protein [Streptomyces sp. B1866]